MADGVRVSISALVDTLGKDFDVNVVLLRFQCTRRRIDSYLRIFVD